MRTLKRLIEGRCPFSGDLFEGLIKTEDTETTIRLMNKNYSKHFDKCYGNSRHIFVDISTTRLDDDHYHDITMFGRYYCTREDQDNITEVIKAMNLFGYIPSKFKISSLNSNYVEEFVYSNNNLIREINSRNGVNISFRFEPKFDMSEHPIGIIYHVTDKKYLPSILGIGLKPSHKDIISAHPPRVYLSKTADGAVKFAKERKIDNPVILTIDVSKLHDIEFYRDPNKYQAIYTYQNIPPNAIDLVTDNNDTN